MRQVMVLHFQILAENDFFRFLLSDDADDSSVRALRRRDRRRRRSKRREDAGEVEGVRVGGRREWSSANGVTRVRLQLEKLSVPNFFLTFRSHFGSISLSLFLNHAFTLVFIQHAKAHFLRVIVEGHTSKMTPSLSFSFTQTRSPTRNL